MTTRDFIARWYGVGDGVERWCSSVFKNGRGDIFSYGYHYPLLFKVAGHWFINDAGYSNTTARHIHWANDAAGYLATPVKLDGRQAQVIANNGSTIDRLKVVRQALHEEHNKLRRDMLSKKRRDTKVYAHLRAELARVTKAINEVGALA